MNQFTPKHNDNMRRIVSSLRAGQMEESTESLPLDQSEQVDQLPSPISQPAGPSAANTRYRKKIEQQIRQMREAINLKEWDSAKIHGQAIVEILDLLVKNPGRAAQSKSRPCPCGSGKDSYWKNDARGIPIARCCPDCEGQKMKKYRPEVLSDSSYEVDEPIDAD